MSSGLTIDIIDDHHANICFGRLCTFVTDQYHNLSSSPEVLKPIVDILTRLVAYGCWPAGALFDGKRWKIFFKICKAEKLALAKPDAHVSVIFV